MTDAYIPFEAPPEVREGARLFCTYCGEWGHLNTPCPTRVIPPAVSDAE